MAAYHHHDHHRYVKEDDEDEYQVAQEEEDQHQMERPPSRQPQYLTPPPQSSPHNHTSPPTTFTNQQYQLPNMETPPSEHQQQLQLRLPPNSCHEDYRSPSRNVPINPNQLQLCPGKPFPSLPPTEPNPTTYPAGYPQFRLPALGALPDDDLQKPPSRHSHGAPQISPNYSNPNNNGGFGLYPSAGGNKNCCTSPPHHHHGRRYPAFCSQLATAAAAIFLFLLGLVSLILYLVYRPSAPAFSLVSTSIFLLNTTSYSPSSSFNTPNMNNIYNNNNMKMVMTMTITTTMQFTLLLHNPSRRASLSYDSLSATLLYRDTTQLLAPPSHLPPLHLGRRATVAATFVVGAGGNPVPLADEAAQAMEDDVRYSGVLPLRLVVDAALRYKVMDGLVKIGPRGIRVTCDVILAAGLGSLKVHTITTSTSTSTRGEGEGEGEGGEGEGVYGGEVPLLSNPHCTLQYC